MAPLKVMGVPLSQPFRSVVWLLLLKKHPFEIVMAIPGAKAPRGTRSPEYLEKYPSGTIPAIDDDGFCLSESNAILPYLCDKNGWSDMYPKDLKLRARCDQFLHWYHRSVREASISYLSPLLRADMKFSKSFLAAGRANVVTAVGIIESHYLGATQFLVYDHPTVADLQAFSELEQLRLGEIFDFSPYPNTRKWMDRMAALPHYDAVFSCTKALGNLAGKGPGELPFSVIKAATMAGTKDIQAVLAKL
ncbi:Glutathione S-transferase T3 [Diplonema papillatum]|nr:Glutathione S-transferase T3 [Diplonema papillatum]